MMLSARMSPLALLLTNASCAMPVMHPYRTHEGPGGRYGVTVHASAEKGADCKSERGCTPGSVSGFNPINVDGRWGHMLGEHVGVMGGMYFPALRNSKSGSGDAALVAYGVLTAQGDVFSFGVGPETGTRVIGGSAGVDIEPVPAFGWDLPKHFVGLTGYGRYLAPYEVEEKAENGRVPSWDAGGSLRIGPVIAQYAYFRQPTGVINYVIYESSVQAKAWHMFTLAVEVNADTLDFETPSDRERERLWRREAQQRREQLEREREWERRHPKPVRKSWAGCDTLCRAQAALPCGIEESSCLESCKRRDVPEDCWQDDDALLICQASGARCRLDRPVFATCSKEQWSLDACIQSHSE